MPAQKPGKSRQDYGTPEAFINAVIKRFGPLACDLAATRENSKAPYLYKPSMDSLKYPWAISFPTGNLWLNPPFENIGVWAEKCALESLKRAGSILFLTPASIGTEWFAQWVEPYAHVIGLRPRLTFEGCKDPYPKDLILSVYSAGLRGFSTWRWDK